MGADPPKPAQAKSSIDSAPVAALTPTQNPNGLDFGASSFSPNAVKRPDSPSFMAEARMPTSTPPISGGMSNNVMAMEMMKRGKY